MRLNRWNRSAIASISLGCLIVAGSTFSTRGAEQFDFNRDIRPILSNYCFQCHGPDEQERKGELRLDDRADATSPAESGETAIVPGDVDQSAMISRIMSEDPDIRMPPPSTRKELKAEDKEVLRQWIAAGAPMAQHWSFVAPTRPGVPVVERSDWPTNPIDSFVLAALEANSWHPSDEADRATLVRRLAFDLTGLPPTLGELDRFLNDTSSHAYESIVEYYLASPHFGERMALDWLDAARFADTNGYHLDNGRDMTAWRAWVIDSFNRDKPYDQFTVEQLAGDLLPNATAEQLVASGFHRNHMINFEGGAIPEEYLNAYIVDRVNTTGTVWLGLTVGCAQCHDHKYDPLTQREFYQLYAFFNNIDEQGLDGNKGNANPLIKVPTTANQRALAAVIAKIEILTSQREQRVGGVSSAGEETEAIKKLDDEIKSLETQRQRLEDNARTAMVMRERETPRESFVLMRGQYDKRGDVVSAATPAFLPPLPTGAPANRLGLAQWLVDPANPLVARVTVNRYWQMIFGSGLVKTSEDFGSQGELPSHAALLDWLAVDFVSPHDPQATPWSTKRLIKNIVMSSTYRQSTRVPRPIYERDPENRLLAHGARFRLQAEMIRDQALAVSGLIKHDIGGASVNPYQPEGLWQELSSRADSGNWTAQVFVLSAGDDLYRRSMYTFWKRTSPPPQMVTFDAPDREICTIRRSRTNTPLQALILANDPTYIESSRKLAERLLHEEQTDMGRVDRLFRLLTARQANEREQEALLRVLDAQRARYRSAPESAVQLLQVGESARDETLDPVELAAWAMTSSVVLNLDEVVTKN